MIFTGSLSIRRFREEGSGDSSSDSWRNSSLRKGLGASTFYEKHGYRVACLLEDFYRKGDHKVIFMKEVTDGV